MVPDNSGRDQSHTSNATMAIIPAVAPKRTPNTASVRRLERKSQESRAAKGSATADTATYPNAFTREWVA